jgi:hypothetical protein
MTLQYLPTHGELRVIAIGNSNTSQNNTGVSTNTCPSLFLKIKTPGKMNTKLV